MGLLHSHADVMLGKIDRDHFVAGIVAFYPDDSVLALLTATGKRLERDSSGGREHGQAAGAAWQNSKDGLPDATTEQVVQIGSMGGVFFGPAVGKPICPIAQNLIQIGGKPGIPIFDMAFAPSPTDDGFIFVACSLGAVMPGRR